jgi:hypothetical protein
VLIQNKQKTKHITDRTTHAGMPLGASAQAAHSCSADLTHRPPQSNENIAPSVVMAVAKELRQLSSEPLEGIKVQLNEEDVTDVVADIAGPGALHRLTCLSCGTTAAVEVLGHAHARRSLPSRLTVPRLRAHKLAVF